MPAWLITLIIAIVKELIALILKRKNKASDSDAPEEERKPFWERVKERREEVRQKREGVGSPPDLVK
jgi:hypothetical protein